MLLRIKDIPAQGKNVNFDLDNQSLNSRISGDLSKTPVYEFSGSTPVNLKIDLQGSTILIDGIVNGNFTTNCSRCAEKVTKHLEVPIKMVLKPAKHDSAIEEDLNFGFYDGEVVNCSEIAEELLVLALPMTVKCESGGCSEDKDSWVFGEQEPVNNPFKNIKLVH